MMIRYQSYLPALTLLVGVAFTWSARSQSEVRLLGPLSTAIPQSATFDTRDQPLTPDELRVLGNTDYAYRIFSRDSAPVFSTFVSYYARQTQGKTIHSPRNCLPGAGWETLRAGVVSLPLGGKQVDVNRSVVKQKGATAIVYYWYEGRGRVVANEYAVKWNLLRDAAVLGHTEEALVRVVVFVPGYDEHASDSAVGRPIETADSLGRAVSAALMTGVARVLPGM